ncbi:MAG: sulfotransferase domain-containing protein [Betaproteobacteria bacterium]
MPTPLTPARAVQTAAPTRGHAPRREADVYVLSYPKAGRTWLRALVGKALVDRYRLPEMQLLDTPALTRAAGLPVAMFDHDGSAMVERVRWQDMPTDRGSYRGKRVLLMGRDVRDILVSAYFQATRRIGVFDGPISAFIRDDAFGVEKILAFYRIWHANRQVPVAFEFVRYEDLHHDSTGTLARVLAFLGADVPPAALPAAVDYCRFENLRRAEAEDRFGTDILRSARDGDPEAFKVRKGKVGNFTEYLAPVDIAFIDAAVAARGCEFTRRASTALPGTPAR